MYLILENVYKRFPSRGTIDEVTAVADASLQIEKGEFVTFLGPSGCGKTTTLRMIAGFDFPTAGNILLDGKNINKLPPHKRDMSMVFQSYAIFPHLSVFENIAYGLKVKRLPKEDVKQRVSQALSLVELDGFEDRTPDQLSGGQQQRVALARALVMEPKVLLMDEPLSNLDAKLREQMRLEIRRIQKQIGITSIYVTHDQTEAMAMSDRIVVMNNGYIEQVGSPSEVYRHPINRFVADFIGRANFIPGKVISTENERVTVSALGKELVVPATTTNFKEDQSVTVVIRPEVGILNPETPAMFDGVVQHASYLGNNVEYLVNVNGQNLTLVENDPRRTVIFDEGQAVKVHFYDKCLLIVPD